MCTSWAYKQDYCIFHARCLCKILTVHWQDRIPNMELERFGSISMEALLMRKRLRWVGHVRRMDDSPLPKHLMYAELTIGNHSHGRPRKRYKTSWRELSPSATLIKSQQLGRSCSRSWRSLSAKGVLHFEASCITEAKAKREHCKGSRELCCQFVTLHLWTSVVLALDLPAISPLINTHARQSSSLLMDCNTHLDSVHLQ